MIEKGSKILLTFKEEGGYKPRFVFVKAKNFNKKRVFTLEPKKSVCNKKVILSEAFLLNALEDPQPAIDLYVLKPSKGVKALYKRLTPNMRIHLHVKKYVADYYGLNFGGKINNLFEWKIV